MKKTITSKFLPAAAFATALIATTANAARTVSISSVSDVGVSLDFGAADGNAYTLAIGYGLTDGGTATNAWDKFSVLGTVAANATTQTAALPAGWGETTRFMRFFLLAPETRPYATRLEYIESTGSQWIDTYVRGKVGVTAEVDLMCREMKDRAVLGSRTTSGTDTRFFVVYWNSYNFLGGIEKNWYYRNFTIATNTRYRVRSVVKNGTQTFSVDGTQIGSNSKTSTFDSEATLALFALHYKNGTTDSRSKARIYSAKIWVENATTGADDLVRDFVPCRDVNNEACLYDLVSGDYFRNAGSGTFTEGAVVPLGTVIAASSTTFALDAGREENGETVFGYDGTATSIIWDDPGLGSGAVFTKVGSNRAIVQTASAINADIDVRTGSLVFSGRTCTNEWYRFVFNGSKYGQRIQIAIGDLRVYSGTAMNAAEETAQGIGANGNVLAANSGAPRLARGQCVANFATTTTVPEGQNANNIILSDLSEAFDGTTKNAVLSADSYYIYNNSSQRWVAFRMAEGNNRVQSYLPVKSNITWHWHPSAWLFQTSVDGVYWQTVDVRTDAISSSGYGSTPFVIKGFLADGAAGFDPTANVKVASGATLDASGVSGGQTLSHLTVDWTAGAGTIRGVTIAQNGVLDLVNVPVGARVGGKTVPVTLSDIANGANFGSWTVRVNGVATSEKLRWTGTALRIPGAFVLSVR